MISKEFYSDKGNTTQIFLGGLRKHFEHKERTIVIGSYTYMLQYGETIFDLAVQVFGEGSTCYWTILADMNKLIPVDDWIAGMEVQLPEVVVADKDINKRVFV